MSIGLSVCLTLRQQDTEFCPRTAPSVALALGRIPMCRARRMSHPGKAGRRVSIAGSIRSRSLLTPVRFATFKPMDKARRWVCGGRGGRG